MKEVRKVKRGQGDLLDREDYREILASAVHPAQLDHQVLRVLRVYRVFKA